MPDSKAAQLAQELKDLTAQIDKLVDGASIEMDVGGRGQRTMRPFHMRAANQIREHAIAILRSARAELLVEMAKEVGLPARLEEAAEEAVVVQQPSPPDPPALPKGHD